MGQWTNYMKIVTPKSNNQKYNDNNQQLNTSYDNYSWYKNVIMGPSNRQQKYSQYDQMDTDYDIARGLDIIAEEIATRDDKSELPFEIKYNAADNTEVSEGLIITLRTALRKFCKLHSLDRNTYVISRITIKNGDCFMRKYGDFRKWKFINPADVYAIELDENEEITYYHIKYNNESTYQYNGGKTVNLEKVPADAIVHFSMSEAFSDTAPFGESILKSVLKVYKQKTLIEDAIVIYRIVRAPERRIFYVDVGNNPPQKAKAILESVKNEVNQKRVASNTGGTADIDSVYNPMCLSLETRIPLLDGRTLPLFEIIKEFNNGKQNWVYSCDEYTGEVKPGLISWAGITQYNTKVMKVKLSNGSIITCTPEHKFPVLNKGFVEAQHLSITDELIPFDIVDNSIFDISKNKYIEISKVVGEFFKNINKHQEFCFTAQYKNAIKNLIIHIDNDIKNNHPANLQFTNDIDYHLYQKFVLPSFFALNETEKLIAKKDILKNLNIFLENNPQINLVQETQNTKIEKIPQKIHVISVVNQKKHLDVGCITVDGKHKYHSHHTFALENGIFTKNSMMEDYFFSNSANGRGSRVETLAGGAGLDQLADLEYFKKGLLAGLRVPSSYINGSDGGGAQYNDGKVGVAYIEELRFANMIKRYQLNFESTFDIEFKLYLHASGIVVDNSMFDIRLPDPQNFALYRQSAINSELISTFAQADGIKYLSKRFILDKFLCLTEDEKQINEMLVRQERGLGEEDDEDSIRKIYDETFADDGEIPQDDMSGFGDDSIQPTDQYSPTNDEIPPNEEEPFDDLNNLGAGDISDADDNTATDQKTANINSATNDTNKSPLAKNLQK